MTLPLRDLLGFDGNTPSGRQILQGSYTPPEGIPQYTLELFYQLKNADIYTSKPKALVSCEDFRSEWKKNERENIGWHFWSPLRTSESMLN